MPEYLIVGNSAAAAGAVRAIREHDRDGALTVVSAEPHPMYSRPLISYLLGGKVREDGMRFCAPDLYERNSVACMLGLRAAGLVPEDRLVVLENGQKLGFAKLLIATGGVPVLPEVEGRELGGVFTLVNWEDARDIQAFVRRHDAHKAVVVGAGLIGLKSTEALLGLGLETTIVELADRILSTTLDQRASGLMEERLRSGGTHIITRTTVTRIDGRRGRVRSVVLEDGTRLDADLVILALGVRPGLDLVSGTSIQVDRGILVNEHMQTSVPGIYAAGDVAQALDLSMGEPRVIAIWPNAYRQGSVAGHAMAGSPRSYGGGLPMNAVELCGLAAVSVGLTDPQGPECESIERFDEHAPSYRRIVLKRGVIVGALCVGDIDRAGILTGLIANRVDVASFKDRLLDSDLGLVSLPKGYRKHLVTGPGIAV